jgi:tetratricopeptide (TPR) repeat protein
MTGEALYERYKEALKRGHVASLDGSLEAALDAYREASEIAPDRPAPHASAGTALLRAGRPADALACYEAGLRVAPGDETTLLGQAQALSALGRRGEAADAYDALAEVRAANGKTGSAVDAARRGLELAEGRDRRRTLQRLMESLRRSEPDEPARLALERALRVLDGPAVPDSAADSEPPTADDAPTSGAAEEGARGGDPPGGGPVVRVRAALDRDLPPDLDVSAMSAAADAALDAGGGPEALALLLDLAAAAHREGHAAVAIDACYEALSLAPDDVGLHLALVELYDDHGWGPQATEKLDLLERLVMLGDDTDGVVRVAAARVGRA